MEDYRIPTLLVLAAFAVQHTLGGRNGGVPHQMTRGYGEFAHRPSEGRPEPNAVVNRHLQLSNIATGSNHQNMHPDLFNERREIHSSQDGITLNYDHRSNIMSKVDAVIDTSMEFSVHGRNEKQFVDQGVTDIGIAVELIDGFGVYINKKKLTSYTDLYKDDPRKLMEALLEEMIDPYTLAREGIKFIPEKVLNAVEVFIKGIVEHKMTSSEFKAALNGYISNLKLQYISNTANTQNEKDAVAGPSHHEVPLELRSNVHREQPHSSSQSADPDLMVELIPQSGVYINQQVLGKLTIELIGEPRILMRKLVDAIMNPTVLAALEASNKSGYNAILENIKEAVKKYTNYVCKVKIKDVEFMIYIKSLLSKKQSEPAMDEQKQSIESTNNDIQLQGSMVELTPKSQVYINKQMLEKLTEKHGDKSGILLRRLFDEIIAPRELATMKAIDNVEYKSIPVHVNLAIKDISRIIFLAHIPNYSSPVLEYVEKVSGTKMTRMKFLCTINHHLELLRLKYGVRAQKLTNKETKSSSDSYIPLPERNPFQTNPQLLKALVERHKQNPQMLIKKLLLEMIPSNELRIMKLTAANGFKTIPIDILNSIKVFVNDVTESKISPEEITRMVGSSLSRERANEKKRKHL